MTDPCADKTLTKTRTGHGTVQTKFWKFHDPDVRTKNGPKFDDLISDVRARLGPARPEQGLTKSKPEP